MNQPNGWFSPSSLFRPGRVDKGKCSGRPRGRHRFRPVVTGLEDRRLLSNYALTALASFDSTNGSGGFLIPGVILDGQGNLYGTTEEGGSGGRGIVFEVASGSKTITTLADFAGTDENSPVSALVMDGQGNLYGMAANDEGIGGSLGSVFEVANGSHTPTVLAGFNSTNGYGSDAGLALDQSGDLYGTTQDGGASGDGTLFGIASGSKTITPLASFNGTNGTDPLAGLVLNAQGTVMYGTASGGGASGYGTVFERARGSSTITPLASFNGTNGREPIAGLVLDSQGNLYGTTILGGASGYGTVFEVASGSNTITPLASFNGTNEVYPAGALVLDGQGNLYGTTSGGGDSGYGTVFEVAKGSNTITPLASFNGTNGANPEAGLVMDGQGNLYGTTSAGGASGYGTVFELTPAGQLPDIAMGPASEVCATSVSVDYAINNAAVTQPLQFNVYQSMTSPPTSGAFSPVFPGDLFVGSATLPSTDTQDLSMGPHSGVILNLGSSALETNPNYPYVVVVANPPGATHIPESDDPIDQNDRTFFELPDIALLDVTTYNAPATDDESAFSIFQDFQIDYSISNSASPPIVLRAYLAPGPNFDPSQDQVLGQTVVSDSDMLQPNDDGDEYTTVLNLSQPADVSTNHYIIVVADPDGMIAETSKTNNNLFAIPILDSGDRIDRLGEEGGPGTYPEQSNNASGPYTGPIVPGTDAYNQLQSLVTTWQVSPLFQFQTNYPSTDTPTLISQKEAEERLGQATLLQPLATLVTLIQLDTQMHPDFWQGVIFSINAAYDSTGAHGKGSSLHYEGRAIDIQPVGGVLSQVPDQIGRLAGLAWLAGFDWSYAEPPHSDPTGPANHLHVSMQSVESVNDVSSQVSAIASGLVYSRATQLFGGTITLTNNGATALSGTLVVVLTNIPSGVTLANAAGETAAGAPYILVDLTDNILELDPGQSINFTVLFSNPQKRPFQYGTSIFDE